MFCYQCEQTAGCKGCTGKAGVCGKQADTAALQDRLTGKLIGLANAVSGNEHLISAASNAVVVEGLFATLTNVNRPPAARAAQARPASAASRPAPPPCRTG